MDWWKEGFQLKVSIRPDGLLIAVLYALACWATRQLSLDQFYLPAGVRVAALLLCPPKLWPYLILGEYAYFAQIRVPLVEKHGWGWVILASVLLMPAVMLIVRAHRQLLARTTVAGVISIAMCAAVVVSLLNLSIPHLLSLPMAKSGFMTSTIRYACGDFIGILILAPLALLWVRRKIEPEWTTSFIVTTSIAITSTLLIGLQATPVPSPSVDADASLSLLMILPIPAIALTFLQGWRGAAIGVATLNLIIGLSTPSAHPESFDVATFTAQQAMVITSIALLLLGARITHFQQHHRLREASEQHVIQLARGSHMASEMDLRERAAHLRKLGDGMDASLNEMVSWLQSQGHHAVASGLQHTAMVHSRLFRAQASMVYPTALEQLGLYVALQAGGVQEAWGQTHRVTQPRLIGDPCQLSPGLQLAAYRSIVEAVSLLVKCESGQIAVRARCGRQGQRRGIVLIAALVDTGHPLSQATAIQGTEQLMGRMFAYGGSLNVRRNRLRMVLQEATTTQGHGASHVSDSGSTGPFPDDGHQAPA